MMLPLELRMSAGSHLYVVLSMRHSMPVSSGDASAQLGPHLRHDCVVYEPSATC